MTVESKIGLIVSVPKNNDYDLKTFRERVMPHLTEAAKVDVFVPALVVLKEVEEGVEQILNFSEKMFGVVIGASGSWWDEVYRKQNLVKGIITNHYGLVVKPAEVRYDKGFTVHLTYHVEYPPQGC